MKELTIEQKAKAYDGAFRIAQELYNNPNSSHIGKGYVCTVFPELRESEDDRIRKEFCEDIWTFIPNEKAHKYIAWLEKQGEKESSNKIEPKFHEGDWIVGANNVFKIISLNDELNCYIAVNPSNEEVKIPYQFDDEQGHMCSYYLWTIQDAKDGDVLVNHDASYIVLFKSFAYLEDDIGWFKSYCHCREGVFSSIEDTGWWCSGFHPATKEQRDTLLKAMADAGYTFDFEKKELKKIEIEEIDGEDYGIDSLYHAQRILEKTLGSVDGYQSDDGILEHKCAISAVKKLYEQKPAWSEEDEKTWKELIEEVKDQLDCVPAPDCRDEEDEKALKQLNRWLTWLKSLKDRVQPKQEWSEEDKKMFGKVLECISFAEDNYLLEKEEVNGVSVKMWLLDHINSRPKQEWSKEDEEMLNQVIEDIVKLAGPHVCYHKDVDWLKSFKGRVQPQLKQEWKQENTDDLTDFENAMMHISSSFFGQYAGLDPNDTNEIKKQANILLELVPKQEWSKEDDKKLIEIINIVQNVSSYDNQLDGYINWLKSLRPQNRRKPSDEQIMCLQDAINDYHRRGYKAETLETLLKQLKQL